MSMTLDLFEDQPSEVLRLASRFIDCEVVRKTDQRAIVSCPTEWMAKRLSVVLNDAGYCVAVKPGRKSSLFYVRVFFNQFL